MVLFKKKDQISIAQLKIQELYKTPREQILTLQKRFDHLQDVNINIDTHVGELKLNAEGEIKKIELIMDNIKEQMFNMKDNLNNLENNLNFLVTDLNLTAKAEDIHRFSDDLERIQPFNFLTVKQFEKLVKDMMR